MQQLPRSLEHLAVDAGRQLEPLRTSLTLTSGKAMSAIWKAFLPYKPNNESLASAYARLKERGSNREQVWTKGTFPLLLLLKRRNCKLTRRLSLADLANLFLEFSIALGVPQPVPNTRLESEAAQLVDQLLSVSFYSFQLIGSSFLTSLYLVHSVFLLRQPRNVTRRLL